MAYTDVDVVSGVPAVRSGRCPAGSAEQCAAQPVHVGLGDTRVA
jgi:hypothetical protein